MNVIYTCYGGTHSSPVAAAIHLHQLPADRRPKTSELMALPRFDKVNSDEHGQLALMGEDEAGNAVFVLGRGPGGEAVQRALVSGVELARGSTDEILIVDTLVCVNLMMRVGGYLSRALGMTAIGRPIVLWGTKRAHSNLVRLVRQTKKRLAIGPR